MQPLLFIAHEKKSCFKAFIFDHDRRRDAVGVDKMQKPRARQRILERQIQSVFNEGGGKVFGWVKH